jgi:hypothetical protein
MDYDTLIQWYEGVYACSGVSRSNVPATTLYRAVLKRGDKISLSMVQKIVQAQRDHHTEWDRHVVFGTPHVLSICPYENGSAESLAFVFGYKCPYLTARQLHRRINGYTSSPISLDDVHKIRREAMKARKKSERAGLFKVSKEARAHYFCE